MWLRITRAGDWPPVRPLAASAAVDAVHARRVVPVAKPSASRYTIAKRRLCWSSSNNCCYTGRKVCACLFIVMCERVAPNLWLTPPPRSVAALFVLWLMFMDSFKYAPTELPCTFSVFKVMIGVLLALTDVGIQVGVHSTGFLRLMRHALLISHTNADLTDIGCHTSICEWCTSSAGSIHRVQLLVWPLPPRLGRVVLVRYLLHLLQA